MKWWIGDTGCGHDLVERGHVIAPAQQIQAVGKSVSLRTANGAVQSTERAQIALHELFERINPIVMKSTPPVLSIGARCYELGYGFVWEPFQQHPWLILPDGKHRFDFRTRGNVPYIVSGDSPYLWEGCSEFCRKWGGMSFNDAAPSAEVVEGEALPPPPPTVVAPRKKSRWSRIMDFYDEVMEKAVEEEDVDQDAYDVDGEVQKHPGVKESLMKEANSVEHQSTHFPNNPYCMACQLGKMQQAAGKRKGTTSLGVKPEAFGDQCTADHIAK